MARPYEAKFHEGNMIKKLLFALLTAIFIFACDNNRSSGPGATDTPTFVPEPNPQPNRALASGKWGADNIGLDIQQGHAHVEFDCATGRINGSIRPNENGNFSRPGTVTYFNVETGENETVNTTYSGFVNASKTRMSLTVTLNEEVDGGFPIDENYILRKGVEGPNAVCAVED
jgi:hypothetical protein